MSSTAMNLDTPSQRHSSAALPFGARPIPASGLGRNAMSSVHRGGFAPPSSFDSPALTGSYGRAEPQYQVTVKTPSSLQQIRMIHKTLEAVLQHGVKFEALLMNTKEVQMEEKWAWIWDPTSVGGVYYRWRMWELASGWYHRKDRSNASNPQQIFNDGIAWVPPEPGLQYEYATQLQELASDSDYHSSDEDDSGDEGRRRYAHFHGGAGPSDGTEHETDGQMYLNPLQKAKLTHLLARLPTSNAKLRRGDVMRVTAFAIQHAGSGSEEIVNMIVINVIKPFAFTSANPDCHPDPSTQNPEDESSDEDTTSAKLVALFVTSDVLSSSSTSGIRHAWRYRQMFESALKRHRVFMHLGRQEKVHRWGRLRAEKWKRSVNSILSLWEGWCVFPQESQEGFVKEFNEPPPTRREVEEQAEAEAAELLAQKEKKAALGSRWKAVANDAATATAEPDTDRGNGDGDVDGEPMAENADDLDGEPMQDDDDDLDGEPMAEDDDLDGEPMQDSDDAKSKEEAPQEDRRSALAASIAARLSQPKPKPSSPDEQKKQVQQEEEGVRRGKRQRPKAEDMFASDGE